MRGMFCSTRNAGGLSLIVLRPVLLSPGLAIGQAEAGFLEVYVIPLELKYCALSCTGEDEQLDGSDGPWRFTSGFS
jgi:hypothetical protein